MSNNKKGFWSGLIGGTQTPRERFSLEELARLNDVLQKNQVVTDFNRDVVVEALRSVAELMIWGDQHDPKFFEFFLEANILRHFTQFLEQRENRKGDMAKQVLQTLSILIQNIRSTTAIFYLFSNNHINEIVGMRFDFEDDEVLGYYINLLKTISLKLDTRTVQFFFHDGEQSSFPLYSEAIKFVNHRDGMVRAAVRTLTLNVYGIKDRAVQAFVVAVPAANYFNELAILIAQQCQALDSQLPNLVSGTGAAVYGVENVTSEFEDLLSYCNDILDLGERPLMNLLQQCLWETFAAPVLFWPLTASQLVSSGSDGRPRPPLHGPSGGAPGVSPLCSLYVAERVMRVMNHPGFVNFVAAVLLLGRLDGPAARGAGLEAPPDTDGVLHPRRRRTASTEVEVPAGAIVEAAAEVSREAAAVLAAADSMARFVEQLIDPAAARDAYCAAFSGADPALASAAVRVAAAVLEHRSINPDLLDAAGLLPQRRKKNRELLDQLTAPGTPIGTPGPADDLFSGGAPRQAFWGAPEVASTSGRGFNVQAFPLADAGLESLPSSPHRVVVRVGGLRRADWIDALCGLLLLQMLPSSALCGVGWLLLQLVSRPRAAAQLSAAQGDAVRRAGEGARAALLGEAGGVWCDALPLLLHAQWPALRAALLGAPPASTPSAVQSWGQVSQMGAESLSEGPSLPNGSEAAPCTSAVAARRLYHAAQRFVSLTLLSEALSGEDVSATPALPLVTEDEVKAREVKEGAVIDIATRLPCSVSFQRGQERSVYFTVAGLPQQDWVDGNESEEYRRSASASLFLSVPCVVLAEPTPSLNLGAVVSVAPLMGSQAAVDKQHKRWLHIDVRPPVRGLLKTLKATTPATVAYQLERQLVDGHWVLAFPDPAAADRAKQLLEDTAARLRQSYARALQPLLGPAHPAAPIAPPAAPAQDLL